MARQKVSPKKTSATHRKKREFGTLAAYPGLKRAMRLAKKDAARGDSAELNVLKSIRRSFRKKARKGCT